MKNNINKISIKLIYVIIFLFLPLIYSCNSSKIENKQLDFENFNDWWKYHNQNIKLFKDFVGKDEENNNLSTQSFCDSLMTGKYIPIKINTEDNKREIYKLQTITNKDKDINSTIRQISARYKVFIEWEGKKFPNFHFKDLKGNYYSNKSTSNKKVLLKTYFIGCHACNAEMPFLDGYIKSTLLTNEYLFLSLALDSPEKLANFLKNKNYQYKFIPLQSDFIENQLRINSYPTHFLIENGIVKKVFDNANDMIDFIKEK